MNPWTALLIGLLLGWLIEFVIDWFFWRRKTASEKSIDELKAQLQESQDQIAALEAQLGDAQADAETSQGRYSELEEETSARVAEAEVKAETAEAAAEASKPKYQEDEFKGNLKGKLAAMGLGAVVVGAVAAGDEDTAEEGEQFDEEATIVASEIPDEADGEEEGEEEFDAHDDSSGVGEDTELEEAYAEGESDLPDEELETADPDWAEEDVEVSDSGVTEGEAMVNEVDSDTDVSGAGEEALNSEIDTEPQDDSFESPTDETDTSVEGGLGS